MKRFLIHVSTYWCGMDNTFRAEAESELELDEIADQLAYDNFQSYGCEADIAEEEGYDPDEMEDSDWDKLWETVDESQYYDFTIEEFEGDDEERKSMEEKSMEKTTRKLNDLLSQFLSLRNEVSEIADKTADAGMVAVFLLDEVLKYNPDFDYHINREWTTTLIKDFDGEINYYVDDEDDAHIIGVGNVNFFTTQTGF